MPTRIDSNSRSYDPNQRGLFGVQWTPRKKQNVALLLGIVVFFIAVIVAFLITH